jgi:hypothetical protein
MVIELRTQQPVERWPLDSWAWCGGDRIGWAEAPRISGDGGRSACLQLVADRRTQARVPAYAVTVGQGKSPGCRRRQLLSPARPPPKPCGSVPNTARRSATSLAASPNGSTFTPGPGPAEVCTALARYTLTT